MATYDLRDRGQIPRLVKGDIIVLPARHGNAGAKGMEGDYGGSFSIDLPKGEYLLEVWGSAGSRHIPSGMTTVAAGTGGYASGILRLSQKTTAILTAGGIPFNGGEYVGNFYDTGYATGSGGASDIRLIRNDLLYRVLVAGGGGASGRIEAIINSEGLPPESAAELAASVSGGDLLGGNGGGPTGGTGQGAQGDTGQGSQGGQGGTQTAGGLTGAGYDESNHRKTNGTFGNGGEWYGNRQKNEEGPGGGGWYGGGGGGYVVTRVNQFISFINFCAGGGGSGFALTSETAGNVPNGYGLGSAYYLTNAVNISGHEPGTPITNPDGTVTEGHYGEGYCRITILDIFNGIYIGSASGKALAVTDIYIGDSSNKARRVIKGYIGDANGKAKRFL